MFKKIIDWVILFIGKIHWKTNHYIPPSDLTAIKELLVNDYFVILTYRKNHLSTFFVNLSNWCLTSKWGRWSHALMNLEDDVKTDDDFRLVEATGAGTHYTPFDKIFDVQGVALLKPKCMTLDEWRSVMDTAKAQLGKPYDTLFDIANDNALSCVELVRRILQDVPGYEYKFAKFENMISTYDNLSPQMFYDCGDFEVVFERRI